MIYIPRKMKKYYTKWNQHYINVTIYINQRKNTFSSQHVNKPFVPGTVIYYVQPVSLSVSRNTKNGTTIASQWGSINNEVISRRMDRVFFSIFSFPFSFISFFSRKASGFNNRPRLDISARRRNVYVVSIEKFLHEFRTILENVLAPIQQNWL